MDLPDYVEPGLLKQVVRRGRVVDQPYEVPVQAMLIAGHGIGQSGRVAAPQPRRLVMSGHGKVLIDGSLVDHIRTGYTEQGPKKMHVDAVRCDTGWPNESMDDSRTSVRRGDRGSGAAAASA